MVLKEVSKTCRLSIPYHMKGIQDLFHVFLNKFEIAVFLFLFFNSFIVFFFFFFFFFCFFFFTLCYCDIPEMKNTN